MLLYGATFLILHVIILSFYTKQTIPHYTVKKSHIRRLFLGDLGYDLCKAYVQARSRSIERMPTLLEQVVYFRTFRGSLASLPREP